METATDRTLAGVLVDANDQSTHALTRLKNLKIPSHVRKSMKNGSQSIGSDWLSEKTSLRKTRRDVYGSWSASLLAARAYRC